MRIHLLLSTFLFLLSVYTLVFSAPDILSPIYGSIFSIHEFWLHSLGLLSAWVIPSLLKRPNDRDQFYATRLPPRKVWGIIGGPADWIAGLSAVTLWILYRLPHTSWIKVLVLVTTAPVQLCAFSIASRELEIIWTSMRVRSPFRLSFSCGVIIGSMFVAPILRNGILALNASTGVIPLNYLPARFLVPLASTIIIGALTLRSMQSALIFGVLINIFISTNVHFPLRTHGAVAGFKTLARAEGPTGYISVLDSPTNYRVLRADQSLLGGMWKDPPYADAKAHESIFGVFVMLETVRLIAPSRPKEEALVIGLGIGTLPSALIAHGVNTTVMELDGTVVKFAEKYFDFKSENPVVVSNALSWIPKRAKMVAGKDDKYDIVVHDVFTGGVEPEALFTTKFLDRLGSLLKEDGKIAINYAGDLNGVATKLALQRILSSFKTCRMFRDSPSPTKADEGKEDFANMVVFCKNKGAVTFRAAAREDYLGTKTREEWLIPKHEVDAAIYLNFDGKKYASKKNKKKLASLAKKSAAKYRELMRKTVPGEVWDAW